MVKHDTPNSCGLPGRSPNYHSVVDPSPVVDLLMCKVRIELNSKIAVQDIMRKWYERIKMSKRRDELG